tara:strand:+ start:728 stop:967 length:240 start_codon:yes stop_codon:yes gene_type:complete
LDPLDPLTEIIKSGQAFSPSIMLERVLWVMMGFFFLGAISTSLLKEIKQQKWFEKSSFMANFKVFKRKDEFNKSLNEDK